jgi:hypothetical protein
MRAHTVMSTPGRHCVPETNVTSSDASPSPSERRVHPVVLCAITNRRPFFSRAHSALYGESSFAGVCNFGRV